MTERRRQTERAARIQRRLWPQVKPGLDDYEVAGTCRPAQDVAGDLYDWIEWPDGRLDLMVADVVGKGIGAALAMASVRAALRSASQALGPAERLELAARSITLGSDDEGLFVTIFHSRLDPWSGVLSYVDAGHGYCAVRRASGELVPLGQRSLPVGIEPGERFREGRIELDPGDMLIVYSDGLVERPEGTVGLDAFADELGRADDADDAVRRLLERTPAQPPDDVTVLILRRLQPAMVALRASSTALVEGGREAEIVDGAVASLQPDVVNITLSMDDARLQLDVVHDALATFLDQLPAPPPDGWRMLFELAVAEIAANIIEHSRPPAIHFQLAAQGGTIAAAFTDAGQGWSSPPGPAAMVDDLVERGRGLDLARTVVDEVVYERRGDINHWRLAKRL